MMARPRRESRSPAFAAENLIAETAALKDRVMHGAESLAAVRAALA